MKRFDRIRTYVRDFYVYGFKTREDYSEGSGRTYDNERRRIEKLVFPPYIHSEYNEDGKKQWPSSSTATGSPSTRCFPSGNQKVLPPMTSCFISLYWIYSGMAVFTQRTKQRTSFRTGTESSSIPRRYEKNWWNMSLWEF